MLWQKMLSAIVLGLLLMQPVFASESFVMPKTESIAALLSQMTLAEKIGQMTLVDIRGATPSQVADLRLGAVLSGGGAAPKENTPEAWRALVQSYEAGAMNTPLQIPLLYGIDAVHGHGNVYGATIFPHNIGLGATANPDLVRRIGVATAEEMKATGIYWNFAPALELPQDYRWGRTYEGFSDDVTLTSQLGAAYVSGLQSAGVLATAKHYVGAGATDWNPSGSGQYPIDQGDSNISLQTLRDKYLPPFQAALDAGALTVMVSLHTWEGEKLHADKYLLTDVLKTEMQFQGFVVSDWDGVKSLGPDYHANIVASINAGMDMVMLSGEPEVFIAELTQAVEQHEVSMSRIDDAVTRILSVKLQSGAFDGYAESTDVRVIGSAQHRELAREAVRESAVLLKNQDNLLPLHKDTQRIFVAGSGADDIGQQSGGWTIFWQGGTGEITKGTTILQAIQNTVAPETKVEYRADGKFKHKAEVAIVVVGEAPYAEGRGDAADLHLSHTDLEVIRAAKEHAEKVVVVLLSGRPMIVSEEINDWDAFVMAWLPGSEAQGLADVLFGDYPFTGKLPFTWSSQMTDLPITDDSKSLAAWPMGFGLTTGLSLAHQPICKPQSELFQD